MTWFNQKTKRRYQRWVKMRRSRRASAQRLTQPYHHARLGSDKGKLTPQPAVARLCFLLTRLECQHAASPSQRGAIFAKISSLSSLRGANTCAYHSPGRVTNGMHSVQPVATSTIITVWTNEPAKFGAAVGALSAELSRGPPSQPRPRDSNQRPSDESRERFALQPADEELDHRRMVEDRKPSCPLNRGGVRRQNTALKQQHPNVRPVLDQR